MCLFIVVLLFGVKNKFIPDDLSTYCNFIVWPHELNIPGGVSTYCNVIIGSQEHIYSR